MGKYGVFMPGLILMYIGAAVEAATRRSWILAGYNICAAGLTFFVMVQSYGK